MNRKVQIRKYIQLGVSMIMLIVFVSITGLLRKSNVDIYASRMTTFLYYMVWALMLLTFLNIFLDLRDLIKLQKESTSMLYAAYYDELTGLPNRHSTHVMLEKYNQDSGNIGYVTFDLNNLKEINDRLGHDAGDEYLKLFAGMLSEAAKDFCYTARDGGDEFIAIIEDCSEEKVQQFLEKLQTLADAGNRKRDAVKLSYAYGYAMMREDQITKTSALRKLSDFRMYQKKQEQKQGKNSEK